MRESSLGKAKVFREVYESLPAAVGILDSRGQLLTVNRAFLELFGIHGLGDIRDSRFLACLAKDLRAKMGENKVVRLVREYDIENIGRFKRSKKMSLEVLATPIDVSGRESGFLVLINDITQHRRLEEDLWVVSEERYRKQFDEAMDAIFVGDAETGIIIDCNREATRLVGRDKVELIGQHQRILHPPRSTEDKFTDTFRQHLKEKEGEVLITQVVTKGGEIRDVAIKANVMEIGGRRIIQGIFRDITEQRRMEHQMTLQAKMNSLLVGLLTMVISPRSVEDISSYLLTSAMEVTGSRLGYVGYIDQKTGYLVIPSMAEGMPNILKERPLVKEKFGGIWGWVLTNKRSLLTNSPQDDLGTFELPQGHLKVNRFLSSPALVNGELVGQIALANSDREYTDQDLETIDRFAAVYAIAVHHQRIEDALEESEYRYRTLFESTNDSIYIIDVEGNILEVNNAFCVRLGYTREELLKMNARDINSPDYASTVTDRIETTLEKGAIFLQTEHITKRGKIIPVENSSRVITYGGKTAILSVSRDISERRMAENKTVTINMISELFLRSDTIEAVYSELPNIISERFRFPIAAIELYDKEKGEVVFAGSKGISVEDRRTVHIPLSETVLETMAKTNRLTFGVDISQEEEPKYNFLKRLKVKSYVCVPIAIKGHMIGGLLLADTNKRLEVTQLLDTLQVIGNYLAQEIDRKRIAEELRKYSEHLEQLVEERTKALRESERLATIGQLTSMIGHDLRNPLQVLLYQTYIMKMKADQMKPDDIRELAKILETQTDYMNNLVSDLQDYSKQLKPDLSDIEAKSFLEGLMSSVTVPSSIEVRIDVSQGLKIKADMYLMKRVLNNLITNAIQAMPGGGRLTVKAFSSEDKVAISVSDTGIGIKEESLQNIFKPFFTTKSKGTGLGLAVVKRIVEAHNGTITIESKVGAGTTFTITLPLLKE